jgi:hypothetical protein
MRFFDFVGGSAMDEVPWVLVSMEIKKEYLMMRKSKQLQLEKENREQLEMSPVAAAERLAAQLSQQCDQAMAKINYAVGDAAISKALTVASQCYRRIVGFSHDVATITGQSRFEQRWNFQARLTDHQRRLWLGLKHAMPAPKPPSAAKAILDRLKAIAPPPKIVEGEHEYQQHLEATGQVEADPNSFYKSKR